jgi:hypothetical protein
VTQFVRFFVDEILSSLKKIVAFFPVLMEHPATIFFLFLMFASCCACI